jgi:hypothetical protein
LGRRAGRVIEDLIVLGLAVVAAVGGGNVFWSVIVRFCPPDPPLPRGWWEDVLVEKEMRVERERERRRVEREAARVMESAFGYEEEAVRILGAEDGPGLPTH